MGSASAAPGRRTADRATVHGVCGRAILTSPAEDVARLFEVAPIDLGAPRFNVAPTQPILTVRARHAPPTESDERGEARPLARPRELALVRWGLIPWWAKPGEAKKIGSRCVQARAETATRAPAFRDAFRRHRCLVVVDGFYEWKTLDDGRRVPHLVRQSRQEPLAIAGLYDSWRPARSEDAGAAKPERIESAAVLTTPAGGAIRDLHDRMPLVLPASEWDTWLGGTADEAARLLEPDQAALDARAGDLSAVAVSTWVNDVRHDDPRCIEPAATRESG